MVRSRAALRFAGAVTPRKQAQTLEGDWQYLFDRYAMPRTAVLSLAACVSALHVQRRHLLTPLAGAASALVAPTTASAGLIDFDPEAAKAAGRARAEQRRAEQKAFTDKLSTLGGVEGQVSTVGGASAVESREKGSGGIIKLKREPDRKGEGLPEPELGLKEALGDVGIDVPEIKYQQKRSFNGKAEDDNSSNGIFKMKRGIGKPLGFE